MKTFILASCSMLAATFGLFNPEQAAQQAVWNGPRKAVKWHGMIFTPTATTSNAPVATIPVPPADKQAGVPQWVGYQKRGIEWYVRLRITSANPTVTETLRRGATTSDGWVVSRIDGQANRPTSVVISKDGVEKTLDYTP